MLHEIILSYWWVKLCFKLNILLPCFGCIPVKNAFWSIHHLADGSFLYNFNLYPLICSICRGACMSSSCSITMQPVGCVFSSWPSLRPSASPGSTVRQTLFDFFCRVTQKWLKNTSTGIPDRSVTWTVKEFTERARKLTYLLVPCPWIPCINDQRLLSVFLQAQNVFMTTSKTWSATVQVLISSIVGSSSPQLRALWVLPFWKWHGDILHPLQSLMHSFFFFTGYLCFLPH